MSDTLTVSNINYRTISGSTITASTIMGSTLSISTLIGSTITASTMTVSRITASTITVSTIFSATGQTAIGNNVTYPNRFVEVGSDVANSMYLDFHSSDAALPDYSTRIQSLGGATTGTGNLNMYASTIGFMPTVGVGIGTTVPQTGVHVRTFTGYSAPGQAAIFESALGAINKEQRLTILINNNDATGGSAAGSYSAIQSAMNNVANTPLILQPNGSNVGIGTTAPGSLLHIIDSATAAYSYPLTMMAPNLTVGGDQYILFGKSASSANQVQLGFHYVGIGSTSNYAFIQNYGVSNCMCWTAGGNVGIGVTNPNSALQVNGNIFGSAFTSGNYTRASGVTSFTLSPTTFTPALQAGWYFIMIYTNTSITSGFNLSLAWTTTAGFYICTTITSNNITTALPTLNSPITIAGLNSGYSYGISVIGMPAP